MVGSKLEIITYPSSLPFKCYVENMYNVRKHHHQDISIVFMLNGSSTFIIEGKEFVVNEDDIILINSNESHEFYSDINSKAIVLQFDPKRFYIADDVFFSNLINEHNDKNLFLLKCILVKIYIYWSENKHFQSIRILHDLVAQLFSQYRAERDSTPKANKHEDRIKSITDYIENNYNRRITLQELADNQGLSVSYLSNFFEKWFGTTFLHYYNDVRIDHAIDDLLNTSFSIDEISIRNGFDDPRSFVGAFKKRYHMLPSVYRKKNTPNQQRKQLQFISQEAVNELLEIKTHLEKYSLNETSYPINFETISTGKTIERDIDTTCELEDFSKNFNHTIGVVCAHDLLLGDVQAMLTRAKKEIGYSHVKFHGILSDDMELYFEDENGNSQYNFFLIDKVLDFIVSIQMKPIIELTFMPKLLALYPEKYIFNKKYLASEPKDMKKWKELIFRFMEHIVSKYGETEVESWEFTIWNLPESGKELFGFDNDIDFYNFYKETYDVLKDYLPDCQIISPIFGLAYDSSHNFFENYLDYCIKNDCLPEKINAYYSEDIFDTSTEQYTVSIRSLLRKNQDAFTIGIESIKEILKKKNINIPIEITTWMLTASHRNLISDTCFKSCYFVKNYVENHNQLESFGCWCLTDLNGESPLGTHMFYGGQGLFTRRGIEKSTYNTFILLTKLGKKVVYKEPGIFITSSHKKIQILLYNYQHYSDLYADGNLILDQNNRYTPFDQSKKITFKLNLNNINTDNVFIKEYIVSRQHGSSYDAYLRMGGIELKYDDEFEHLKRHSSYYIEIEEMQTKNNMITIKKTLDPHAVHLIEIKL